MGENATSQEEVYGYYWHVYPSKPMRGILTLALVFLLSSFGWAADDSKDLKMAIYRVPPGMVMKPVDAKGEGGGLIDGVKRVEPSPFSGVDDVYDIQSFFKSNGIQSPEGSKALLLGGQGILWVRDTTKNLDSINDMLGGCDGFQLPVVLRNEISVVQFNSQKRNPASPPPTLSELVKAAGDSWKKVCSLEVISKSGQIVTAATSSGTLASKQADNVPRAPEMQPNDAGATCAVESILGPDGSTVDSNFSFRYQSAKAESNKPLTIVYNGSTTFWDGRPQILQYIANEGNEPSYAVIMRITLAFPDSKPMRDPDSHHLGAP